MRIDKINYYLDIAEAVLQRSTCIRRKFGAVLVKDDMIVSTGYNGSIRGAVNCCDLGTCKRNDLNLGSGIGYEYCVAVHAEQNAIINVASEIAKGSSLYLVGINVCDKLYFPTGPCSICMKLIQLKKIKLIYVRESKMSYHIINV